MVQHWALFNLTDGKGITPRSLGAHSNLPHLVSDRTLPCALLYLIADSPVWSGARLALAGDEMKKGDLPEAKVHAGIKDVDLMKAIGDPADKRMIQRGWQVRALLQEKNLAAYGKHYREVPSNDGTRIYKRPVVKQDWYAHPVAPPHDRDDVLIVNTDRNEHLDPKVFGGDGSLFDTAWNGWNAGAGSALVMMLAAGNRGGEGDLPAVSDMIGSWAGDRIGIIDRADLTDGSVDVSQKAQDALCAAGITYVVQTATVKVPKRKNVVLPKRSMPAPV